MSSPDFEHGAAAPDEADLEKVYRASRMRAVMVERLYTAPWWLAILVLAGILLVAAISADAVYSRIFDQLKVGVSMTLGVSFMAYFLALVVALLVGLIRSTPPEPPKTRRITHIVGSSVRTLFYNLATIYVQIMRGLPTLIVLLVAAFVLVPMIRDPLLALINGQVLPAVRNILNDPDVPDMIWRGSSPPTAIVALAFTYGAYMSETVRAGIQSVERGQIEAAKSVGMTYYQTMRYIVLPQAFRNVLPPLGNDLIAMVKDSSLLSILGINDITQIAKKSAGSSFRYLETYMIVAFIYLVMTVIGSTFVRALEDTLDQERDTPRWIQVIGDTYGLIRGNRKPKPDEVLG